MKAVFVIAALLAGAAVAAADPSAIACHQAESRSECETTDACVFCRATVVPSGCFLDSEAKLLPGFMYNCTDADAPSGQLAKKHGGGGGSGPQPPPYPQPGAGCMMVKDKKACKHSKDGCVWCEGMFGQASCFSADQAKFMPSTFYKCTKPDSAAANEVEAEGALEKGHKKKKDDKTACWSLKDGKACRKADGAKCEWCEAKMAPGLAMCVDESQAKLFPAVAFDCAGAPSKHDDDDDDDDAADDDERTANALTKKDKKDDKKDDDKKEDCRDIKERKPCRKSDSDCSWCTNKFAPGQEMCTDAASAKFLPPMVFECAPSKHREADSANALEKKDKKKDNDDKKEDCKDIKERKPCRKSASDCSWCTNKFAPGQEMCTDEASAKFLPPMVFDCEGPKKPSMLTAVFGGRKGLDGAHFMMAQ